MAIRVRLAPLGTVLETAPGTSLRDLLFPHGVEFPCGGRGACRGCRVRIVSGAGEPGPDDRRILAADEIARGWRLACRAVASDDLTIEVEQWASAILADDHPLAAKRRQGAGIAVDVGTTTLVAQMVDLAEARVLAVRTALNPQAVSGADIMSRVAAALAPAGAARLRDAVRAEVGRLVAGVCHDSGRAPQTVVLVGNTVMHHLFCGLDVAPLAATPFDSPRLDECRFDAAALGWDLGPAAVVRFLPCVRAFVGSDLLAGVRALHLADRDDLEAFVDLGTNAEIVVAGGGRILCASTAAGPAFEGGRISRGMRAANGAICEVSLVAGRMTARVLGGGRARGVCGSGLVDAVRCGLELGRILPTGRLAAGARTLPIDAGVALTQADVRELQLAKAAVAAGLRTLAARLGATLDDLACVHLAGAFGNYVSRSSACWIGLVPVEPARIRAAGNTALHGAKLALFDDGPELLDAVRARVEHVPLAADPQFADAYVDAMRFPEGPVASQ
jgi:uncharacterized 2Fe-2S/4Fe-4S cluster protein (DUF4445 family)